MNKMQCLLLSIFVLCSMSSPCMKKIAQVGAITEKEFAINKDDQELLEFCKFVVQSIGLEGWAIDSSVIETYEVLEFFFTRKNIGSYKNAIAYGQAIDQGRSVSIFDDTEKFNQKLSSFFKASSRANNDKNVILLISADERIKNEMLKDASNLRAMLELFRFYQLLKEDLQNT